MISDIVKAVRRQRNEKARCCLVNEWDSGTVLFDSLDSENWEMENIAALHSIQRTGTVTDSLRPGPERLVLHATLTNHTGISYFDESSLERVEQSGRVTDVILERLELLHRWRLEGTLLSYYGAIREKSEKLIITKIVEEKNGQSGDAVAIKLTLKKIDAVYPESRALDDFPRSAAKLLRKGVTIPRKQEGPAGVFREYIDVSFDEIPVSKRITFGGESYTLEIRYNEMAGFFTILCSDRQGIPITASKITPGSEIIAANCEGKKSLRLRARWPRLSPGENTTLEDSFKNGFRLYFA